MRIKVASVALNQVPLDWQGNLGRMLKALEDAKREHAQIVCFPELCISGYGCADAFLAAWVVDAAWRVLEEFARHCEGIIACVGLPLRGAQGVYNGAAVVVDRKIVGLVAKRALANDGIHYEGRWFEAVSLGSCETHVSGIPMGDVYFRIGDLTVAVEICRDAWLAVTPSRALAAQGVDVVLNPSASHYGFGKLEVRRGIAKECSRTSACCYVYSNLLGCESGSTVFDGDCRIASEGQIVAEGARFAIEECSITTAVVDVEANRSRRFKQSLIDFPVGQPILVSTPVGLECDEPLSSAQPVAEYSKFEDFTLAATAALFDYLSKSHSKGFVISLSGGADSGAVLILTVLALKRAWRSLGKVAFLERNDQLEAIGEQLKTEADLCLKLITTVYQATVNSSAESLAVAEELAQSLGSTFFKWQIQPLVDAYTNLVQDAINEELDWSKDDLVLQNIQPRVRVPGVWMLANHKQALLLNTGNRSEAVVGYCTMDGDTAGGFNPIGGVSKYFLLQWLEWISSTGPAWHGPLPGASRLLINAPSAELRPQAQAQTDESDLMPYVVLERMEVHFLHVRSSPKRILNALEYEFKDEYSRSELKVWLEKFLTLLSRSQWKRERLALALHVDAFGVDARGCFRFPALNSGFRSEREDLQSLINVPG